MSLRKEIATFHTVIFTAVTKPGAPTRRMHVLYLFSEAQPKPLIPFLDYILETGRVTRLGWQKASARSLGLFIDFLTANAVPLQDSKATPKPLALFAEALICGTLDMEGVDPSGLYWEPRDPKGSRRILSAVTQFGDWAANRFGTAQINPWRKASVVEQIAFWRRNDQRRANQLLAHLGGGEDARRNAKRTRTVTISDREPTVRLEPPKMFPRGRFGDLLLTGFKVRGSDHHSEIWRRLNIRDVMITILLHAGGLRESEPFHLYVSDVAPDPQNSRSALVRLFHPVYGRAPADFVDVLTGKPVRGNREQYLREKWHMHPRNRTEGRFKAGWKDLLLSSEKGTCGQVHWFPAFWGQVFFDLFKVYINHCRSRHCKHPFLFISEKPGFEGDPYTVDSYRQSHDRAVRRIGLLPRKEDGTTGHGHRHSYGQNLADAKTETKVVQVAMHHKSPHSQAVYTAPGVSKVVETMAEAEKRLEAENLYSLARDMFGGEEVNGTQQKFA